LVTPFLDSGEAATWGGSLWHVLKLLVHAEVVVDDVNDTGGEMEREGNRWQ
jgi:hypothetical protein